MSVLDVIENGYCVGCGNCSFVSNDLFVINSLGFAELKLTTRGDSVELMEAASRVCPFSNESKDEDEISKDLYSKALKYDKNLGWYSGIYVGHDCNDGNRIKSSSGGLATKTISELFARGDIDAAIVVAYDDNSRFGVGYRIVCSDRELGFSRQSKYILAGYGDLIEFIKNGGKRIAFVGVPCHVKAIRLLSEEIKEVKENIVCALAVFCGHQKTSKFRNYIAWQMGVDPGRLGKFFYRIKHKGHKSHEYFYRAEDMDGNVNEKNVADLKWMDWGLGLFKLKACDFCDDVAGEVADVIFGDAWIKPYTNDYKGNNIVVTRSKEIDDLLNALRSKEEITLIRQNVKSVLDSQAANFRHRKEGTISRMFEANKNGDWVPAKRKSLLINFLLNKKRHDLYLIRQMVSSESHRAFEKAENARDLQVFFEEMSGLVGLYYKEYKKNICIKTKVKNFLKKIMRAVGV